MQLGAGSDGLDALMSNYSRGLIAAYSTDVRVVAEPRVPAESIRNLVVGECF